MFQKYRDLGAGRSLAKLAKAAGRSLHTLERWSADDDWYSRALAWDDFRDRQAREAELAELRDFRRRQVQVGRLLQGKGLERIRELRPNELPAVEARRYVVDGANLERAGLGEQRALMGVGQGVQVNQQQPLEEQWAALPPEEREARAFLLHALMSGASVEEIDQLVAERREARERAGQALQLERRRVARDLEASGDGRVRRPPTAGEIEA